MFGYYRFILALMVTFSHIGVEIFSWGNIGPISVVGFYVLAGYVVTHLWVKVFDNKKQKLLYYYIDRLLRIYPLFLFVCLLSIAFLLLTQFGDPDWKFSSLISTLTLLPLHYQWFYDITILTNPKQALILPSWSLALECHVYLILPFVLKYKWIKYALVVLSLTIFLLANLSILDKFIYGYFLAPGVFFIFILGSCIYNKNILKSNDLADKYFPPLVVIASTLGLIFIEVELISRGGFQSEVLAGIIIAYVTTSLLSKFKNRIALNSVFGSLSYGLFLTHFLALWIYEVYFSSIFMGSNLNLLRVPMILLISIIISYIGYYFIDRPISNWRFSRN